VHGVATIVFFKRLITGKVKTRLASQIGHRAALLIYKAMIRDLMRNLHPLLGEIFAFEDSGEDKPDVELVNLIGSAPLVQRGNDLGERMCEAFIRVFGTGVRRALLIGSDIPHITAQLIECFFFALDDYPLVLGPAEDGGYYLIGFREDTFSEDLFKDVHWSTQMVLEQTLSKACRNGLNPYLGEKMRDIDMLEDLEAVLNDSSTARLLPETYTAFGNLR